MARLMALRRSSPSIVQTSTGPRRSSRKVPMGAISLDSSPGGTRSTGPRMARCRVLPARVPFCRRPATMNRRVCLFALLLMVATPALARVGGGQHYSGSHSSSSSGSRSSGGSWSSGSRGSSWSGGGRSPSGGDLGFLLFFVSHPLFTLALIGVAFVVWRALRAELRGDGEHAAGLRGGRRARGGSAVGTRGARPGWTRCVLGPGLRPGDLPGQGEGALPASADGLGGRDLAPVRPYLSDATFQRFRVQLELLRAQGVRNVTRGHGGAGSCSRSGLERTTWFDSCTCGSGRRRETRTCRAPRPSRPWSGRGGQPLEPFTEVWSFVRRARNALDARMGSTSAGQVPQLRCALRRGRGGHLRVLRGDR